MTQIERIKRMSATDLAEWLFVLCLNCNGMSKGDFYRMLQKDDSEEKFESYKQISKAVLGD